jgi:hypothetical protein
MAALAGAEVGGGDGRAASRRDAHQAACGRGREQDDTVFVPRAFAAGRRFGEHRWRPACQVEPFELAVREERNGVAVRRPEWITRAVGPLERSRTQLIERTQPEFRLSVGRRDKRKLSAVRRQRKRRRIARRRR